MTPFLLQNDPNPTQRTQALEDARKEYQWDYYPNRNGIAMIEIKDDQFPAEELPSEPQWFLNIITVILIVFSNRAIEDFAAGESNFNLFLYAFMTWIARFIDWLSQFLEKTRRKKLFYWFIEKAISFLTWRLQRKEVSQQEPSRGQTNQQQNAQNQVNFKSYKDLFEIIHLPCISHRFQQDREFAAQRVAGPNPLVINLVKEQLPDKFPLTNEQYCSVMGEQDSLEQAIGEKRLYLADYEILYGVRAGNFPPAYRKYIYAPLALFAVPQGTSKNRSLVPVAIQCEQTPGANNPIFTSPPPGTSQNQRWYWLMAKTIVQIADGNYHQLISHLGRTHLLIEPFAIATQRQLAVNHPLGILLRPHFEGTLLINHAARLSLINKEGTVDAVLGGTIEESVRIAAEGVMGYPFSFNDSMLPKILELRGVNDADKLPDYPYRDDALLIWNAIHQWVYDYLSLYYENDQDVQNDTEVQQWLQDLISNDGGRIKGMGETTTSGKVAIETKQYLIDVATMIIFTGSAQHAAVNFPQKSHMSYVPNMPLAGYRPAPTTTSGVTERDYFNLLPPIPQAETQMNTTYALGAVYYTKLGYYEDDYFEDQRVQQPLQAFQNSLRKIETMIEDRNEVRPTFYDVLSPSLIPQSINI
ncbi:MAG: lipoxygenase [Moorea sp. SIO2B7]|nr:lipoxygenase [Moorena sp. SIO2B7]